MEGKEGIKDREEEVIKGTSSETAVIKKSLKTQACLGTKTHTHSST